MQLENCRYIVVEGPAGAGKTELARALVDVIIERYTASRPAA